jgi:hypothetical protein
LRSIKRAKVLSFDNMPGVPEGSHLRDKHRWSLLSG